MLCRSLQQNYFDQMKRKFYFGSLSIVKNAFVDDLLLREGNYNFYLGLRRK